jgi:DNA-binding PadR family transcriptional regulator
MLDGMYLDIAILRHLTSRPSHGYQLKQSVQRTMAFPLHNNSLYPALRRFEEAGAVRKTLEPQEGKPARHVYEITEVGRELLHDMLAELPPELAGNEDEFLTRVGLFDQLTTDERRAILAAREAALAKRADHLADLADRTDASEEAREWGGVVMAELRGRVERERAWLGELAELA